MATAGTRRRRHGRHRARALAALAAASAALVLAPAGAFAQAGGAPVVVGVGGTAPPALAGPIPLTTDGYGPGVSEGEDGTTHVAWNEPRTDLRDAVRYCRVVRPGTACTDPQTFLPSGHVTPDSNSRYPRQIAHSVFVLTPRPDTVIVLTTRYRDFTMPALAVSPDGSLGCAADAPCTDVRNPVFAWISTDNGVTFTEKVIADQRGGVEAATTVTVDDGTADERDLILLFGGENRLNVTSAGTFTTPCADLTGPGGNLPVEAGLTSAGDTVTLAFNQGDSVYTRRFKAIPGANGAQTISDLCDVGHWSPWDTVPGQNNGTRLAGGPRGTMLLTENQRAGGRVRQVRDVSVSGSGATTDLGTPHGDDETRRGDIAQDGLGGLAAAWVDPQVDSTGRVTGHDLKFAHADSGQPFLAATTLRPLDTTAASDVERLHVSVLDDGGGAIAYQHSGAADPSGPASISLLLFGTRTPRPVDDVHLAGAELTQGIQQADPLTRSRTNPGAMLAYTGVGTTSARLIRGKPTVLRAYATVRSAPAAGIAMPVVDLKVFRNGAPILSLSPTPPSAALPVDDAFTVEPAVHQGVSQVYTFVLPPVNDGASYTYELEVNPAAVLPGYPECRQCRGVDNFLRVGPQTYFLPTTVNIRPLEMAVGSAPNQRVRGAAAVGPTAVLGVLGTLLPLNFSIPPYQAFYDISDIAKDNESALDRAADARDLVEDWADDTDNDRSGLFPIGLYPYDGQKLGFKVPGLDPTDSQWLRGGKSENPEYLDPASCWISDCVKALYQDRQPIAVLGDSTSRDVIETAHEVVHGLGFKHAGQDRDCYTEESQIGEKWPFGDDGRIDGIGLDTRSGAPPFARVYSDPSTAATTVYDMMSYCLKRSTQPDQAWLGLYNWNRISAYFAPPQTARRSAPTSSAAAVRSATATTRQAAPAAGGPSLLVTASVPTAAAGAAGPAMLGHIVRVEQSDHAPVPRAVVARQGPYAVVGYGPAGAVVFEGAVERSTSVEGGATSDTLRAYLPPAGITRVDVVRVADGAALATRTASPAAPTVRITSPKAGATVGAKANVDVTWTAKDADGGTLETVVEYAADGRTYRPIGHEPAASHLLVPARLFSRASRARLRVRVNDGFHEASATVGPFRALGAPPEIQVRTPGTVARGRADASFVLDAIAFDDTGTQLAGRSIRWKLGKKTLLIQGSGTVMLPAGRQRLTVEARDRFHRLTRRFVVIDVAPAAPRFLRLTGPSRVKVGARKAILQVASAFPATLRVQGRTVDVGRKPVAVPVTLPRAGARVSVPLSLRSGPLAQAATVVVTRR